MSCAFAIAPQETTATLFQFCDLYGKTKIGYYQSSDGASLQYQGPEGHWTFHGSEITQEETSLGLLLSVVLRPGVGSAPVTFWLFLPPVILGDSGSQSFVTYGMKNGSQVQRPRKQISYEGERFFGEAKAVMLPL
jgi:hypothetical protein